MSRKRNAVKALLIILMFTFTGAAHAMKEWKYHKTRDGKHPDANEQQMLWLTNRARSNPAKEGNWLARSNEYSIGYARDYYRVNRTALRKAFAKIRPKPPAAFDVRLFRAALAHSKVQIQRDVQDHAGQVDLINKEGFYWDQIRYNVFSYSDNALNAHAGFNIDWGAGGRGGMQQPPHHRLAVMSVDGNFTNVGIAGLHESNPATEVGRYVVSQNFCHAVAGQQDHFNVFIVGTVWRDANANDRYDPGEGIPDVTVTPSLGEYFAVTAKSGGYAIPVTHAGRMQVQFSGTAIEDAQYDIAADDVSVLLDHKLNANGNPAKVLRSGGRAALYLSPGIAHPRQLGNRWGNDRHERSVSATFGWSAVDLLLSMRSYHINRPSEAEVFVNGESLGFLRGAGRSDKGTKERFIVPASSLSHSNKLEIRQRYNGEKWGIDELMLAPALPSVVKHSIEPGNMETGTFGWGVGGRGHRAIYRTVFNATGFDFDLEFEAYNVRSPEDLEVLVNGRHIGWAPENTHKSDYSRVNFPVSVLSQTDGENVVEFRSHQSTRWGVRNIQLRPVSVPEIHLKPPATDKRRYGWRFPGARHRTMVRRVFNAIDSDLVLSLQAKFEDDKDAVSIFVNNKSVGQIRAMDSGRIRRFSIPIALQQPQRNVIEIKRLLRSARKWHVSNMQLRKTSNPSIFINNDNGFAFKGRKFGWRWGDQEHRTVVRAQFIVGRDPTDLLLMSSGFNVTKPKQVSVFLNDTPLGFVSVAKGKLNTGDRFILPAQIQQPGNNVIEFRNRDADAMWGITDLALDSVDGPRLTLSTGLTDYRRYGVRGVRGVPASVVTAEFYSTGEDLDLEVFGYDIEVMETVDVYLNENKVGSLAPSLDNGHSTGEHIFIPMRLQRAGKNKIQFRRTKPHSRWGVTAIGLMPLTR